MVQRRGAITFADLTDENPEFVVITPERVELLNAPSRELSGSAAVIELHLMDPLSCTSPTFARSVGGVTETGKLSRRLL